MVGVRSSSVLFAAGGLFLLLSPLILSREGQVVFWGIGSVFVLAGLWIRGRERPSG